MNAVLICAENMDELPDTAVCVGKLYHAPRVGLIVRWHEVKQE